MNAVLIVLFVVPMTFIVARIRVMTSIAVGVFIATIGTLVYGSSPSIYVLFIGIALFSLGEMLTGPKKTEYFSLIAPKGKKALYLGYVNIPVALGQGLHQRPALRGLLGLELERAQRQLDRLPGEDRHHGRSAFEARGTDVRPRIRDVREDLDLHGMNAT